MASGDWFHKHLSRSPSYTPPSAVGRTSLLPRVRVQCSAEEPGGDHAVFVPKATSLTAPTSQVTRPRLSTLRRPAWASGRSRARFTKALAVVPWAQGFCRCSSLEHPAELGGSERWVLRPFQQQLLLVS